MKNLLFLFITLITFVNVSYAAFPVANKTEIVVSENLNFGKITSVSDTPIFGILSIILAVLSALLIGSFDTWTLSFIFAMLAVIFGALGFNKRLKGLAITGFIIGLLEVIFSVILYLFILFALAATNN